MAEITVADIVLYDKTKFPDTDYNCFATLAQADAYLTRRLVSEIWFDSCVSEEMRKSALFWATDILHRQRWRGEPLHYSNNFAWPRRFVPNRNSLTFENEWDGALIEQINDVPGSSFVFLDFDEIPQFLVDATAELALHLIRRDKSGLNSMTQYEDQLSNMGLGNGAINLTFRENNDYIPDIPYQVYKIIDDFLVERVEIDPSVKGIYTTKLRRS